MHARPPLRIGLRFAQHLTRDRRRIPFTQCGKSEHVGYAIPLGPGDASQFTEVLTVEGAQVGPYRVLRCQSPAIPNAIAALLLYIRDKTGHIPHA